MVMIGTVPGILCDVDDHVRAFARAVPVGKYSSAETLNDALRGQNAICETITVDDLDVLLLRNNPSAQREWAQAAGIHSDGGDA